MRERLFAVYVLASRRSGTLYIGVTSDLVKRVWEHKEGFVKGFTRDHGVSCLVWFELHESAEAAITREKQLQKWNRAWKIRLIEGSSPYWNDLYATLH
jgi:putative endonuclease